MQKSFFAENLKLLRKARKISLEELAEAINISKSALSDYENEKFSPTLAASTKIVNFFGTSLDKMEYSEISEKINGTELKSTEKQLADATDELAELKIENNRLEMEVRLANQKIESLKIQQQLYDQLKNSKMAEIELLYTQIRLLEDKIRVAGI